MSRIMKFYCDRCKKEYDPTDLRLHCESHIPIYKALMEYNDYEDKCDLCPECFIKLNKFMNLGGCNNEECSQD